MGRWANLQMVFHQFPVSTIIGQLTTNIEKQVFLKNYPNSVTSAEKTSSDQV